jgi:hypothetical protein
MTTFPDITPKSAERKKLALRHLGRAQTFATLDISEDSPAEAEPLEIEATRAFEPDINNYYHFPIDYTPYFERRWNLLSPSKWLYFIDINDEVIEKKFPRDQDMRSIITAFRYSIIRNRRHIITLKRGTQALGIVALLLPALVLAYVPALTGNMTAVAGLGAGALLTAVLLAAYQYMRDSQLKSVLERNGRTLASKIQDRANDLNRHFLEFFARIDREELNDNIVDPEWTHRSAWWMKLCMWYPRRIEAIEMFLQSEMQRTRIYMLRSAWMGYISAFVLILMIPLAALLAIALKAPLAGGGALVWMLWLAGTVAGGLLTLYSIRTSMGLKDIAEAIGKEPLGHQSRFADIDLHNKLAGQIRRDKEGLRQAQLRGGYGERRSG